MKNSKIQQDINNYSMTDKSFNTEGIVSLFEENLDEDEEELDLLKLVCTNENDLNQYLLFLGSDNQYYAQNVGKIEELLVYKDLEIVKNHDKNNLIFGTANIRGETTSIIFFDKWLGSEVLSDDLYELVILFYYGEKKFAMVVKEVIDIVSIISSNMINNSSDNLKASFISHLVINKKESLCTIFDGDLLLQNVFNITNTKNNDVITQINTKKKSNRIILFADDSLFIRKMVETLFKQLGFYYKIYNDGEELINNIKTHKTEDIALIITDLEMPRAGGKEVITFIRNDEAYNDINIIVHTNMHNNMNKDELIINKVSKLIKKVDMLSLSKAINKYIK